MAWLNKIFVFALARAVIDKQVFLETHVYSTERLLHCLKYRSRSRCDLLGKTTVFPITPSLDSLKVIR